MAYTDTVVRNNLAITGNEVYIGTDAAVASVGGNLDFIDKDGTLTNLRYRVVREVDASNHLLSGDSGKIVAAHYDSGAGAVDYRLASYLDGSVVSIAFKTATEAAILSSVMMTGEVAMATDSKSVFWYDGSNKIFVGRSRVDLLTNRPSAGVSGRFFYASDTGALYLDTGSVWVSISGGGGVTSNLVMSRRATLAFNTASPLNIGSAVAANSVVTKAIVNVSVSFNGTTPTVSIGVAGNTSAIASAGSIKLKTVGLYDISSYYLSASGEQIIGTYVPSGSTAGSANILIEYHIP